jgi:Ser/Thr protein kinase RdoA (MazF antagonist)
MFEDPFREVLAWCDAVVGPCEPVDTDVRFHGRTSVLKLRTTSGLCYLKVHRERATWDPEVHAYENWVQAFGDKAPRLLAVREEEPLALLIAELPGETMADRPIPEARLLRAWHDAGRAVARLHGRAVGEGFGPCRRDGTTAGPPVRDAVEYVSSRLAADAERVERAGFLDTAETSVVRGAQKLVGAYAGERPVPCHRDYGPDNWLIDAADRFIGVIDFEMSAWDARVADFSRYPRWEWMLRPDLVGAFFDGYGRTLTTAEQEQLLVAHVQYALSAIQWGHEHEYHGFVREGHDALATLGKQL